MNNIILIGMPGAGKSTIGVLLAKTLGYKFVDTDLLIQEQEGALLQDIINQKGLDEFLQIEERINSNLEYVNTIIATGGSVVYSEKAMEHLKKIGKVIYLELPINIINKRVKNIKTRGVAMQKGQTLEQLYEKRCPLYEKYADAVIEAEGKSMEELVEIIVKLSLNQR